MHRPPIHQPPPSPLVDILVRAGLSHSTVLAMDTWKAREVLDLLRLTAPDGCREPTAPARGSI